AVGEGGGVIASLRREAAAGHVDVRAVRADRDGTGLVITAGVVAAGPQRLAGGGVIADCDVVIRPGGTAIARHVDDLAIRADPYRPGDSGGSGTVLGLAGVSAHP